MDRPMGGEDEDRVGRRYGEARRVKLKTSKTVHGQRHVVQSVHTRTDTHDERAGDRSEIGDPACVAHF